MKMEQHHAIRQTAVATVTENGGVKLGLRHMMGPIVIHLLLESSRAHVHKVTAQTHTHTIL